MRGQDIFTHGDVCTDFRQILKEIELFTEATWFWSSIGIFQVLKPKSGPWSIEIRQILFFKRRWSGVSLSKALYEQLESSFVHWKAVTYVMNRLNWKL